MAGYEINSNTLSFLKFDKKNDVLYDSIVSESPIQWTMNSGSFANFPDLVTNKSFITRKNSFQGVLQADTNGSLNYRSISTVLDGDQSDLLDKATYNSYSYGAFETRFSYGSFTIDFWIKPMAQVYKNMTILELNANSFSSAITSSPKSGRNDLYYLRNAKIILSNVNGIVNTNHTITDINPNIINVYFVTYEGITLSLGTSHNTLNNSDPFYSFTKIGTVYSGQWNHIALMKSGDFKAAVNGTYHGGLSRAVVCENASLYIGGINNSGAYHSSNIDFVWYKTYPSSYPGFASTNYLVTNDESNTELEILYDNVRLSKGLVWTSSFTPPGLVGKQIFVYDGYAYYVEPSNNQVLKLSFTKWDDISDSDKLTLLDRVAWNYLPDVDQIKSIQTDPTKDIICYNYQSDASQPTIKIEKINETSSQIIYPTQFMDYGSMEGYLDNIYASYSLSAPSIIRLAVTKDGETYYGYNFTNNEWVPLDHKSDIITDGILAANLKDIPKVAWIQFGLSRFTFGIALVKTRDNDTCSLNDITLKISLTEKWVKANKTTQAKIKYIGPTMMKVTFLEDGKYKINYNDRR